MFKRRSVDNMGIGLCVKDIEFNGAMLRAAEVENIIYVGVRWICHGLGLSLIHI